MNSIIRKMEIKIVIKEFWKAIVQQHPDEIRSYFKETAIIRWHNTNEEFTVDEFIRANDFYGDIGSYDVDYSVHGNDHSSECILRHTQFFAVCCNYRRI